MTFVAILFIPNDMSNTDHNVRSPTRRLATSPPRPWHLSVTESSVVLPPHTARFACAALYSWS